MSICILIILSCITAVAKTTFLHRFSIMGAAPDITLIILTFLSYQYGIQRGQIVGFFIGILEDMLSVSPLGFYAFTRMTHCLCTGISQKMLQTNQLVTPVVLVGISVIVQNVTKVFLVFVLRVRKIEFLFTLRSIEFILTVLCAPIIFFVLMQLLEKIQLKNR